MKKETRTFFIIVLIVLLLPFRITDEEHISEDTFVSSPTIISYSDTVHSPARARAVLEVCAVFKTFALVLICICAHVEVKSNVEFYGRKRIRVIVHRFHPD